MGGQFGREGQEIEVHLGGEAFFQMGGREPAGEGDKVF